MRMPPTFMLRRAGTAGARHANGVPSRCRLQHGRWVLQSHWESRSAIKKAKGPKLRSTPIQGKKPYLS
jgi:hypothetical protein